MNTEVKQDDAQNDLNGLYNQARYFVELIKTQQDIMKEYLDYAKSIKTKLSIFNIIFLNELMGANVSDKVDIILKKICEEKDYKTFLKYIDIEKVKNLDPTLALLMSDYIGKIQTNRLIDDEKEKLKHIKIYLKEKKSYLQTKDNENAKAPISAKDVSISNTNKSKSKNKSKKNNSNSSVFQPCLNIASDDIFSQMIFHIQNLKKEYTTLLTKLEQINSDISRKDEALREQTDKFNILYEEHQQTISDNKNKKETIKELKQNINDLEARIEHNINLHNEEIIAKDHEIMCLKEEIDEWKKANIDLQNSQDYSKNVFIAQLTQKLKINHDDYVKYKTTNQIEALKIMLDNIFAELSNNGINFKSEE